MKTKYRFLRFPGGKTKAVTFSYDDGCLADIRFAEMLTSYGMKGTFNVNSAHVSEGGENILSVDQIKEHILSRGHELAVHGYSHKAPASISPVEAMREVLFCRLGLERMFDMIIRGMAYPDSGIRRPHNGNDYPTVRSIVENAGIAYARTLAGDNDDFTLPSDWFAWMPTIHHDNPCAMEYVDKFISLDINKRYCSDRWPRLFYVWGHTYEFDRKNNWDHIQNICERLSGKDDTWYATNIEIYDYVNAYNSLIISADSTKIYNPTLITVWFHYYNDTYSIAPGETLKIGC